LYNLIICIIQNKIYIKYNRENGQKNVEPNGKRTFSLEIQAVEVIKYQCCYPRGFVKGE
jgi:hypothetical protein